MGVRRKGNMRQVAFEIEGVTFAVAGMVEQAVNVVEDIPLCDRRIVVVAAKLVKRPIGDVLAAVGAVFVVGVEGEALASQTVGMISGTLLTMSPYCGQSTPTLYQIHLVFRISA